MNSTVFTFYLPPDPDEVTLNKGDIFIQLGKNSKPHVWTGKKWAELKTTDLPEEPKPSKNRVADILWGLVALISLVFVIALAVMAINHEKSTESRLQNLDSVVQII